jgi:hypothetical protein
MGKNSYPFPKPKSIYTKKPHSTTPDLSLLSEDANTVLNVLLLELMRDAGRKLQMSDDEIVTAGRELMQEGRITIIEHAVTGDFSLRVN